MSDLARELVDAAMWGGGTKALCFSRNDARIAVAAVLETLAVKGNNVQLSQRPTDYIEELADEIRGM